MNRLFLLRHAKAARPESGTDRERPLAERGREAARRLAGWIGAHRLSAELALCSSALRAQQTLDLVLPGFAPVRPEIIVEEELYLADAKSLLTRLRRLPERVTGVLLVGHNPGLEQLAQGLADVTAGPLYRQLIEGLPTAALVVFEMSVPWPALDWRCARPVAIISPKHLTSNDH